MNINSRMADNPVRENMFLSIGFNFILPMMILMQGDKWFGELLSEIFSSTPTSSLVGAIILILALSFPLFYGTFDLIRRRKWNLFSILGIISVLLTGGIGLVPGGTVQMFVIKETAIPTILGLAVIITLKTKKPLVRLILYNPEIINVSLIDQKLDEFGTKEKFDRLLVNCTWLMALAFTISAILNFVLARMIVVTEPSINKIAYNEEVGQMMGWSFLIISVPISLIMLFTVLLLSKGINKFTGLTMENILLMPQDKKQ